MPTEFDDPIIYELGVLVAAFIFLDQTVTDLWVDLSDGAPELSVRAQFMPIGFSGKIEKLKDRIQERLTGNPAVTPIVESSCSVLDRAAEVAKKNPIHCKVTGACPGYVVDQIKALKRGGADDPGNMQWQSLEDAKAKDRHGPLHSFSNLP